MIFCARDYENVTDADIGEDMGEDKILEPLSDSEDEDEEEGYVECAGSVDPEEYEELLKLGKTFSCPNDFKIGVLRYYLKI